MSTIYVIGLGPGSKQGLPMGSYQLLKSSYPIFLRTGHHPVVRDLAEEGIQFDTFDEIYDTSDTFDDVYRRIVDRLLAESHQAPEGTIVYGVPGHPGVAERTVGMLQQRAPSEGVEVVMGSGHSFMDDLLLRVGADPTEGLLVLDALSLEEAQLNPSLHTLLVQVYSTQVAGDVKLTLMEVYPDEYPVTVVQAVGIAGQEKIQEVPLYELDRIVDINHLTSVYMPPAKDDRALNRQVWKLLEIVKTLRSPEGCPWDRKQTHATLRKYVIEEAYEVADAIDRDEPWDLAEELGDLLLQVALHAQIGREMGTFSFADVLQEISDKLIRRHPHVFASAQADNVEQVLQNWEAIKREEKANKFGAEREKLPESLLDKVKPSHPSLQVAYELQATAAKVGFDWTSLTEVLNKAVEETNEIRDAKTAEEQSEEVGDLLFAVCNIARFLKIDPEAALAKTNLKFRQRFHYIEQELEKKGKSPGQSTLEEMDQLWNEAKLKFLPNK